MPDSGAIARIKSNGQVQKHHDPVNCGLTLTSGSRLTEASRFNDGDRKNRRHSHAKLLRLRIEIAALRCIDVIRQRVATATTCL
jgi:hypothetical protein